MVTPRWTTDAETEAAEASDGTSQRPAPLYSDARALRPAPTAPAPDLAVRVALLKQVALLASLDEPQLTELARAASLRSYEKDALIVRQGDPGGSLLVVEAGCVELYLEAQSGDEVPLATLARGEFFGELSLFDGEPRSASARAGSACRIVEIHREFVISKLTPMVTCLLGAVAARVRKTDKLVAGLSDQIARTAHVNAHAAVAVELDSVKLLYQRTEKLAGETLDHAQERSRAVLAQAEQAASEVSARFERERAKLQRLGTWIGVALTLIGVSTASWAKQVYDNGEAIEQQRVEIERKQKEIEKAAAAIRDKGEQVRVVGQEMAAMRTRLAEADRALRIVRETVTDLRSTRDAAGLGQRIESLAQLRRAAQHFEQAKLEVAARYLTPSGGQFEFEPEVVLDAAMTYMTLASESRGDQQLVLSKAQRGTLGEALLYVLKNLPERRTGDAERGQASWAFELQLNEAWRWLQSTLPSDDDAALTQRLTWIMNDDALGLPARKNAALVYARMREPRAGSPTADAAAKRVLRETLDAKSASQLSLSSAFALAQLGDEAGWQALTSSLDRETSRYQAATALAEEGRPTLLALARKYGHGADPDTLVQRVKTALDQRAATARNCFEQRYARRLSGCLDGTCPQSGPGAPLGGECLDPPAPP